MCVLTILINETDTETRRYRISISCMAQNAFCGKNSQRKI